MLNEGGKVFIDEKIYGKEADLLQQYFFDVINERPELVEKMLKAHISA